MTEKIITVEGLSFSYPEKDILKNVSFEIRKGELAVLCGPSGCGKTTLIRHFRNAMAPCGIRSGNIFINGRNIDEMDLREQTEMIGFVQQSPQNQIVTDKVWHELAFGMESLGYENAAIRQRVAEMAQFFGITDWFYKNVSELSGGQKQLLNLAAVMAMEPQILILDEPTGQLDPIAAADFLNEVARLNRELGITVLLIEQRLEEALPMASRVLVMDEGKIICDGGVRETGLMLREMKSEMFRAMPAPMRVWAYTADSGDRCPVTVAEGRSWLENYAGDHVLCPIPDEKQRRLSGETAVSAEGLWYRFTKEGPDILKGLSLDIHRGEFAALLGGNGSGKSTLLKLLCGLKKPYRGEVKTAGKVAMLPQDPETLFVKRTVREDLFDVSQDEAAVIKIIQICHLRDLLDMDPYDLSGGERQRLALAKVLLTEPEILLMDEPTKGVDAGFKYELRSILRGLTDKGMTILMVSHDVEFSALCADRCMLLFDGAIVSEGTPRRFFSGNSFYTTAANRMAREVAPFAVTAEELIAVCGGKEENSGTDPEADSEGNSEPDTEEPREEPLHKGKNTVPLWKKIIVGVSAAIIAVVMIIAMVNTDFTEFIIDGQLTEASVKYIVLYGLMILAMIAIAAVAGGRSGSRIEVAEKDKKGLTAANVITLAAILICIPFTIYLGTKFLGDKKYYITSIAVMLECMIPIFAVFEGRKPKARELVLIAVLTAVGVIGRIAFGMLPNFNPVTAIVIIAGISLGGEVGFITGAMTMLVSNFVFAQGPWTPWQMFAMGLIGFLAGIIFGRWRSRRTRAGICIFGALAAIVVYGGIMNPASAIIWQGYITREMLMTYYFMGLPVDLINAAATAIFLWIGAEPMIGKLERIKIKYGLI